MNTFFLILDELVNPTKIGRFTVGIYIIPPILKGAHVSKSINLLTLERNKRRLEIAWNLYYPTMNRYSYRIQRPAGILQVLETFGAFFQIKVVVRRPTSQKV